MHNPPSEKLIVGQQLLKERQDEERRQVVMDFLDKVLQQARDAGLTVREALIFSAAFRGALEEQSGALLLSELGPKKPTVAFGSHEAMEAKQKT